MARRPPPTQPMPPAPAPTNSRQNEYFIPRDGIDREVITADICRYLGNDALVRPGTYEDPETGHSISGYYITAYRNLTTAMIEDLKADSARWEQERRAKSSRNASGVQYHHSDTYARRQRGGPSETVPFGSGREFDAPPPHDGPGYPGYPQQGGGGQFMQQPPQPSYPGGNQGNAYSSGYPPGSNQYSQQDPGYASTGQSNMAYSQNQDTWVHGAARPMNPGYREPQYSPGMGSRDHIMTTPPQQGNYPPPQHPQPGYGGQDYYNSAAPGGGYQTMPQDPQYGRGAYQDRASAAPVSKPPERFGTAAPVQPTPEVYGSMQGQIQGQMQGQQYEDPSRNHKQNSVPAPPRRQETPKHQPYKSSGGHR